jgi:hypothetical protein
VTGFAQGTAIIDVQLPEPDKYDLEKIMSSPGESDTKFVYKPATDPDPGVISKDTLTAHSSTNNTTHHAASNVTRVRMEKTAPPATKETVQKQSKNQEESPKAKTDDDSIMSFNFLYYIIEKYKLQDIVD